jgi:argininosuccinate lyase
MNDPQYAYDLFLHPERNHASNTKKHVWKGRFKKEMDKDFEKFNASIKFDKRLFRSEIVAAMGHVFALGNANVISSKEVSKLLGGLSKLLKEKDEIVFSDYEDIHSAVENELVKRIGLLGKKIHTGRSRNDLVATDTRIYLKSCIKGIKSDLKKLMLTLTNLAEKNIKIVIPGYTHLQHAQMVSVGHWLMSYYQMFKRDYELLTFVHDRTDVMPLGSGALAGSSWKFERQKVANLIQFKNITQNSMDAVADRDFLLDFIYFTSILAMHFSRFSEEIVIFNSSEFAFVEIDDSFATGSSLMPNKKNPDIPELMRGKTGIFYGQLMGALTMMKGLPMTYNKDLQEDKRFLFKAIDEIIPMIRIFTKLLDNISFNEEEIQKQTSDSFMYAVDLADYLVRKGVPFRESHEKVGNIIRYCLDNQKGVNVGLDKLDLKHYKSFSNKFEKDVFDLYSPQKSLEAKITEGSTSFGSVKKQIANAREFLKK